MCLKPPERAWNDETKERYDNSNIRFKISIIRSNLCDHSNSYILVIGIITVPKIAAAGGAGNNTNKKAIFVLLFWLITKINDTKIDNAQKIDVVVVVMPIYNLIEYSDQIDAK